MSQRSSTGKAYIVAPSPPQIFLFVVVFVAYACVMVLSKLEEVSDALLSVQLSSAGIPDELCFEGTF